MWRSSGRCHGVHVLVGGNGGTDVGVEEHDAATDVRVLVTAVSGLASARCHVVDECSLRQETAHASIGAYPLPCRHSRPYHSQGVGGRGVPTIRHNQREPIPEPGTCIGTHTGTKMCTNEQAHKLTNTHRHKYAQVFTHWLTRLIAHTGKNSHAERHPYNTQKTQKSNATHGQARTLAHASIHKHTQVHRAVTAFLGNTAVPAPGTGT